MTRLLEFDLVRFQEKLEINFKDTELLKTALTHSSYANQFKDIDFNERLEFLGDSVLQICISEYLFDNCRDKSEGELTKTRALIVCENSLYEVAKKLEIGSMLRMSKGEELTGGRERASILADCVEAIIAAIYLDSGLESARRFIIKNFSFIIEKAIHDKLVLDFKTKLQEVLQQNGEVNICYELVRYEGPPHRRKFFSRVIIDDVIMGEGDGFSKKEAEQRCAKEALTRLEEINEQ